MCSSHIIYSFLNGVQEKHVNHSHYQIQHYAQIIRALLPGVFGPEAVPALVGVGLLHLAAAVLPVSAAAGRGGRAAGGRLACLSLLLLLQAAAGVYHSHHRGRCGSLRAHKQGTFSGKQKSRWHEQIVKTSKRNERC